MEMRDGGAIVFSLSRLVRAISREFKENGRKKLSFLTEKQTDKKTNQQQISMVYTLIDHRNDVKMFKLGRETTLLGLVVPLEF